MIETTRTRAHDLALAIRHYLAGAEEVARLRAYEVARDAMAAGVGVLEILADHQQALAILLSDRSVPEAPLHVVKASAELIAESLGPFEMAYRGFQEANASLLRVNADLERQINQRERAEEAARIAGEAAERANKAKSEFLSGMSHELRTPLNAVLGFAQLLEMDALEEGQQECVEQILKGGRHLLELTSEVLDIARIESGGMSLSIQPLLTEATVMEAVDLIEPLAVERGVSVRVEMPPDIGYVLADSQRTRQVLLNLLSNGVKYNVPDGTIVLSCALTADAMVQFQVQDEGPGLPQADLQRLFLPFERLGAESTGVEGTGLGLALSKRLAEAMGGTLEAESTVGSGSTFTLRLPIAQSSQRLARAETDGAAAAHVPAEGPATLLYVEDNAANLRLVERVVAGHPGYRLRSAPDGGRGVELAQRHHPDVILLDLDLPDISGEEVLRRLQIDPRTRDIPVVIISAEAAGDAMERLLEAGAEAYLTKPVDIQGLLAVLQKTLAKRRGDRAS